MALKNIVRAIPLQIFNTANLVLAAFTPFANPLPHACFAIKFINRSNRSVYISYDGVTYHDCLPADSELPLNFQQLHQPSNDFTWMKQGTRVYLRGQPIGAVGFIYLCGYYQESL